MTILTKEAVQAIRDRAYAESRRRRFSGMRTVCAIDVPDLCDTAEALRDRLEINHRYDGDGVRVPWNGEIGPLDGIGCRDETIRMQDAEIERLKGRQLREGWCAIPNEALEHDHEVASGLRARNAALTEALRALTDAVWNAPIKQMTPEIIEAAQAARELLKGPYHDCSVGRAK